jgi:elongation factor P
MMQATLLRPGVIIKHEGDLYTIFSVEHRTPGNKRGFMQVRMRNLRNGSMTVYRFSSEDRVDRAIMDEHEMQYMYNDGDNYYFMNTENYEQTYLTKDYLGDAVNYLLPDMHINVEFYEEKPVGIELPATVDLLVVETEPAIKGATVSNVMKPAKTETGLVVNVPPFISEGDRIRVNTAEGTYQERA